MVVFIKPYQGKLIVIGLGWIPWNKLKIGLYEKLLDIILSYHIALMKFDISETGWHSCKALRNFKSIVSFGNLRYLLSFQKLRPSGITWRSHKKIICVFSQTKQTNYKIYFLRNE